MLGRVAAFAVRRHKAVLIGTLLMAFAFAAFGATVTSALQAGGFLPADAESTRATEFLSEHLPGIQPNFLLTVSFPESANSAAARSAGDTLVAALQSEGTVGELRSYWSTPAPLNTQLLSKDGRTALILGHIAGDESRIQQGAGDAVDALPTLPGVVVHAGGYAPTLHDSNDRIIKDLAIAEAVTIPLSAVVLVLVFGSVVAAMMPLAIGLFSIVCTLAILRTLTLVTDVSVFALNMATALGMAVAIDYSLFIVSRYREELANGATYEAAAIRAVHTAGRTVMFSAVAVGIGICATLVYPMYFLRSLAMTGIAVAFAGALASVIALPALLVALGPRIDKWDLRPVFRIRRRAVAPEQSWWYRLADGVMQRAGRVAIGVTAVLLFVGIPFLSIEFGSPDDRTMQPGSTGSRAAGDILRDEFAQNADATTYVVLPGYAGSDAALEQYAAELSDIAGVSGAATDTGVFTDGLRVLTAPAELRTADGAVVAVATAVDPFSADGKRQLDAIRAVAPPGEVLLTGSAPTNEDFVGAILAGLPWVGLLIVLSTLVVLFLFTGSVLLPLKALVMNLLSLTTAFGAMVWIFQEGHLSGLLGFTPTGYLAANTPVIMFCIAFGMSMDYEVFLLSRIREEWLQSDKTTAANRSAVAMGIARTGGIFTAAAVLMAVVLGGLATSKISFIQMFGIGMALTALVDATVIRCLLVPAVMRLAGRWNWWAPKPLRRLHDKIGLSEISDRPERIGSP